MTRATDITEMLKGTPITKKELVDLEVYLDKIFAANKIDFEFTRHFLDRVNDERNKKQITISELKKMFKEVQASFGKKLTRLGHDAEAVLFDTASSINTPVVMVWDKKNKEFDLITKTVMRKKGFKTKGKVFKVTSK